MEFLVYFVYAILICSAAHNFSEGKYIKLEIIFLIFIGVFSFYLMDEFEFLKNNYMSKNGKYLIYFSINFISVPIFYIKYKKHYKN